MLHPRLFGVRTLIFDMDGTVIRSGSMAIYALRKAIDTFYQRKNLPVPSHTDEELTIGLGAPSNDFYRQLLTEDVRDEWEEFRELVHSGESEYQQNHRVTFPGSHKVLGELRKRGYKLALISNCNRDYIDSVIYSQNLARHFHKTACIGDYKGATKTELFNQVISELGGPAAAVGDRYYDVDAGKANNIPVIGALYGYGTREELAETDTWITDIRQLPYLFDPIQEEAEKMAGSINSVRSLQHPTLVALDTPHITFANALTGSLLTTLTEMNIPVSVMVPEKHYRNNKNSPIDSKDYYSECFDWKQFQSEILDRRPDPSIESTWEVTNGTRKGSLVPYRSRAGSVLLVVGSFLLQDQMADKYDITFTIQAKSADIAKAVKHSITPPVKGYNKNEDPAYLFWKNTHHSAYISYVQAWNPLKSADHTIDGTVLTHSGGKEYFGNHEI